MRTVKSISEVLPHCENGKEFSITIIRDQEKVMRQRNRFGSIKTLRSGLLLWIMALCGFMSSVAQADIVVNDAFTGFSCGGAFVDTVPAGGTRVRDCGNGVSIVHHGGSSNDPSLTTGVDYVQFATTNPYIGNTWVLKTYTLPALPTVNVTVDIVNTGANTVRTTYLRVFPGTVTNPYDASTPFPLAISANCIATCTLTVPGLTPQTTTITVAVAFNDPAGSSNISVARVDNVIVDRVASDQAVVVNTTQVANGTYSRLWSKRNNINNAQLVDLKIGPLGNVYAAGITPNIATPGNDIMVTKTDPNGTQLWQKSYEGGWNDSAAMAVVDISGNFYVTGYSSNGADTDYVTIKYDVNGAQQWVSTYDNAGNDDEAVALTVDTSGNVYVTGRSCGATDASCDYKTVKYNSNGAQQWVATYDNGDQDEAVSIGVDGAGNVVVTGHSMGVNHDIATVQYNTATGAQNWATRYTGASHDYPSAMVVDSAGNAYVTGRKQNAGIIFDYITLKYDNTGAQVWSTGYDGGYHDLATAIAVDSSGNVYVTGASGPVSNYDYATVKYDAGGVQQWAAIYDSGNDDQAVDIAVDDNTGQVFVTGKSGSLLSYNFVTIAYDAGGTMIPSLLVYDNLDNDTPAALDLAYNGGGNPVIYVGGTSWSNTTNYNFLINKNGIARPDLTPIAITGFASAFSGQTLSVNHSVQNLLDNANGIKSPAGAFDETVYLVPSATAVPSGLDIIWKDLVGVSATGNTITKTAATGWGNGGAASTRSIPGDGAVEFTAANTNTYRMLGLSNTNVDANYTTIQYALFMLNNATLQVYESGTLRGTFGAYAIGDVLRVERTGSTVTYKRNGGVIYTSAVPSSGSLIADAAIYDVGATISNARIYGSLGADPNTANWIAIGSSNVAGLAPGAIAPLTTSVTIPDATTAPQGTYYLASVADTGNTVTEMHETNNTLFAVGSVFIQDAPDLIATAVSGPANAMAGDTISVNYTVQNQRTPAVAGNFDLAYVLSTDGTIGNGDDVALTPVSGTTIAGLAGNSSTSSNSMVSIPGATAANNYYIGITVDSGAVVAESDETNNTLLSVAPIAVSAAADLTITAVSAPLGAFEGDNIIVGNTVHNPSTADAGAFTVGIYLSTDATITTGDTLIGSRAVAGLLAGQSDNANTSVTIPAITAGVYYIGALADSGNVVPEISESNNYAAQTISIATAANNLPDLVITAVSGPTSAARGDTISVSTTVENVLPANVSETFKVGIYLSADPTITITDIFIGERSVAGISGNSSDTASTNVTIPLDLYGGGGPQVFYLGAIADYSGITAPQDIVWTDLVGASVSGNTITKTAATGWGTGGAASVQTILADGAVEFTPANIATHRMFGLSNTNVDANYFTIQYAIYAVAGGPLRVYENGVNRGTFGAYVAGDVLRVERTGTTVTYKQNGVVFYTSTIASTGSLIADAALYHTGATITNARIYGGGVVEEINENNNAAVQTSGGSPEGTAVSVLLDDQSASTGGGAFGAIELMLGIFGLVMFVVRYSPKRRRNGYTDATFNVASV